MATATIRIAEGDNGLWYLVGEDNNGVTVLAEPGVYYSTEQGAQDAADAWNDTIVAKHVDGEE